MFVAGAKEAVLLRVLQVPPCSLPASGVAMDLQAVARLPRPQLPLCPVSRRHRPHRRHGRSLSEEGIEIEEIDEG